MMASTGAPLATIATELDRLVRFDSVPLPMISLYVNLQVDEHGKHNFMLDAPSPSTERS